MYQCTAERRIWKASPAVTGRVFTKKCSGSPRTVYSGSIPDRPNRILKIDRRKNVLPQRRKSRDGAAVHRKNGREKQTAVFYTAGYTNFTNSAPEALQIKGFRGGFCALDKEAGPVIAWTEERQEGEMRMFFRKKGAEEMRETQAPRGAESVVTDGPEKPKTEITLKAVPEIPDAEQTDQTTPEAGTALPDAAGEAGSAEQPGEDPEAELHARWTALKEGEFRELYDQEMRGLREEIEARERESAEQLREVRAQYPSFDLEAEKRDPEFADMLAKGLSMLQAYRAAHHETLVRQAVREALGNRWALLESAGAEREMPVRTGSLTKGAREEIARRALRGEKITLKDGWI